MKEAVKSLMYRREDMQFACTQCGFASNRSSVVEVHVEAKHMETGGFVCPVCQKHCPTRNSLNIHKYRYHNPKQN